MTDHGMVTLFGPVDTVRDEHGYGIDKASPTDPANLYILSLTSKESRDTMRRVLKQIALLSGYACIEFVPWAGISRQGIFNLLGALSAKGRTPRYPQSLPVCHQGCVGRRFWPSK
jgi:hypothetical protein